MLQKWRPKRRARKRGGGRASTKPRARDAARAEQRRLDLIGLALIGAGIYVGGVLYAGWDGGQVGGALATGLSWGIGLAAHVLPVALVAFGVGLIVRPMLEAPSAINAGATLVFAGVLLAFAAETAGLGAGGAVREGFFETDYMTEHGGVLGEGLYWSAATLLQRPGAHLIALLFIIAGAVLASGATITTLLERGGSVSRKVWGATTDVAVAARNGRVGPPADQALTDVIPPEAFTTEAEPTDVVPAAEAEYDSAAEIEAGEADGAADESSYAELTEAEAAIEAEPIADIPESEPDPEELTPMGNLRGVTASEEIEYSLPPVKLLKQSADDRGGPSAADHEAIGRALLAALREFGVDAKIVGVVSGPHVSRYELQLAPGIKVAKIAQLKDDLAYALASTEIRILAPIPGKRAVGVEVPNRHRRTVRLGDIYRPRPSGASPLVGWLGKDVAGQPVWTDISRMPHVLIAGTTGSGKSGCVNALLSSILLHASPNEVRLVLVDPKRVELNHYDSLPHLLTPVVTAPRVAANVLANLISEMDNRYEVMEGARARSLDELNRIRRKSGEPPLPHVLCVIDELADLMMVAPAEVEDSIIRLAQKSRAVGIHLVLATQRPSTDVITGTIKVNIPARIAFAVASQVDSRVILDQGGAESLLGQGDMLFRAAGTSKLERIQGAFVTEEEIAKLTSHWARQGEPEFDEELLEARPEAEEGLPAGELSPDQDELLAEAVRIVVQTETASVSMIQRRLRVGYTRAGRLIDMLERRGVISGYEGSKPRQVLIGPSDVPRILGEASPNAESAPETPEPAEVLS